MPWKTNKKTGGVFNTDWDTKDYQIAANREQAKELTGRDDFDEQFRNDRIRDDYEPRRRQNVQLEPLPDKKLNSLRKRLDTIANSPKFSIQSLRKLEDEIEDLKRRTGRPDLDELLSEIKSIWIELR